jgi:hypothetical protein
MQDVSEEKRRTQDQCIEDQRKFLAGYQQMLLSINEHAAKIEQNRASIENVGVQQEKLGKELDLIRQDHQSIMSMLKQLQPILDAYQKGMSIKSKLGTIAIAYIILQFILSKISHDQLISIIKLAI